jgi:hypothetical protein
MKSNQVLIYKTKTIKSLRKAIGSLEKAIGSLQDELRRVALRRDELRQVDPALALRRAPARRGGASKVTVAAQVAAEVTALPRSWSWLWLPTSL